MIEQTGIVERVEDGYLDVRVDPEPGCARCASGQGCGQGVIGQLRGRPSQRIRLRDPAGASVLVGQGVVLGIAPRALLTASVLLYGVPLLAMILAALLAGSFSPISDGVAAVAGLAGLLGGLVLARWISLSAPLRRQCEPRLLRCLSPAEKLLT